MSLKVLSCCTYLIANGGPWRGIDYDAHDFVHAVKGRSFDGYVDLTSRGAIYRISSASCNLALRVFGERVAAAGAAHGLIAPVVLVPVPNSRCDVACDVPPRTRAQAAALAEALGPGSSVADILRWRAQLPPASTGAGTRDPQTLYENLCATGVPPGRERPVVIVDDVLTTGGHLQACAARLRRFGVKVALAVVAGRSDRAPVADPFATRLDELPDFTPSWFKLVCSAN